MAQTATVNQLESALEKLEQYGQLYIKAIPEPAELFSRALVGRLRNPIILTELDDLLTLQQTLAKEFACASSSDALLSAVKALRTPRMVVVQAQKVSLPALQYLVQLSTVNDAGYHHLPLVVLQTPMLTQVLSSAEGKSLALRFALSFSVDNRNRRGPMFSLAMVALLAAGAGFGYLVGWSDWGRGAVSEVQAVPQQSKPLAPVLAEKPDQSESTQLSATEDPRKLLLLSDQDRLDIQASIEEWRLGWETQNWQRYAGSYIMNYLPMDDDISHEEWASWRRARIERPDWIRIGVDGLKLFPLDHYQVRITFSQSYEAPDYADRSIKELYLVRLNEGWKINAERSLQAR